jgi:amino acid adenylation domain-containing protein
LHKKSKCIQAISQHVTVEISTVQRQQLFFLCQKSKMTIFQLTLAALAVYFSKTTSNRRCVFGAPVHNRNRSVDKEIVGMMAGVIPYLIDIKPEQSLYELLMEIKTNLRQDFRHQRYPISHLKRVLRHSYSINHELFDVLVNYEAFDLTLDLAGLDNRFEHLSSQDEKTPLQFRWCDYGDQEPLKLKLSFRSDYFTQSEAKSLADKVLNILMSFDQYYNQNISNIPIITQAESKKILVEWNATEADYPETSGIHQLFETQAQAQPEAIAVVFGDQSLTYRELNQQANQLAHYLREQGVQPDTLVGLCVERSLDMIVGLLGILKAGGAYVPLDPSYPAQRLAYMLDDSGVKFLITQHSLVNRLSLTDQHCILLNSAEFKCRLTQYSTHNIPPVELGLTAKHLAYVIYTSGSTGKPKGVLTPHQAIIRLVINNDYVPLNRDTVMAQCAPVNFDAMTFEVWGTLLNGGLLALYPLSIIDLNILGKMIEEYKVNTLWLTAGLFDQFVLELYPSLKSIKYLLTGGDIVSPVSVQKLYSYLSNVQIINAYGPTENTTFTCCYHIPREISLDQSVPIGHAIKNTQLYVLAPDQSLLPIGIVGELYIGGVGLARGYLNRPELTAEKFIANPFSDDPHSRLYRTGDLVRWLPDGQLAFIGRADHQVKIRGFRIELGEIESALVQHALVQEAVVLARETSSAIATAAEKRLVAYVVVPSVLTENSNQQALLINQLRAELKQQLPDYMVPQAFVLLDQLPLTPNAKVDRKALPEPDYVTHAEYIAPETATEIALAALWQRLLSLKELVSLDADFFELGGHSLLAIKLMAEIEKTFGYRMPIRKLFEHSELQSLARAIDSSAALNSWQPLVNLQKPRRASQPLPTLYVVPGAGGLSLAYQPLSQALESVAQVQVFEALGLDGLTPPHQNMTEIVDSYLSAILANQSEGPYYLFGHSFGGGVVFELSQRLESLGHKVLVFVADTELTGILLTEAELEELSQSVSEKALMIFEELLDIQVLEKVNSNNNTESELLRVKRCMFEAGFISDIEQASLVDGFLAVYEAQESMFMNYRASGKLKGQLVWLHCASTFSGNKYHLSLQGFQSLCDQKVLDYQVEGTHVSLIRREHVGSVAKVIQRCLKAQLQTKDQELALEVVIE